MNHRAIVTGANRGLGLEVARQLVQAGVDVTTVARSETSAHEAQRATGAAHQAWAELDDLASVRGLASRLLEGPRLTLLVHNAGVWPSKRVLNSEGLEQAFVVNHLAPFLLTHLLEGHLERGARVVQVSAGLAVKGRIDLERTPRGDDFSSLWTYATTKLCNLALTARWAARLHPKDVTFNAVHPGVLRTGLGDRPGLVGALLSFAKRRWSPAEGGARSVIRLCLGEDVAGMTGAFFDEDRRIDLPPAAADPTLADALWKQASSLCGIDAS